MGKRYLKRLIWLIMLSSSNDIIAFKVERRGGGEAGLYDLRQEDAGGG